MIAARIKPAAACTSAGSTFAPADTGWLTVVTPVGDDGKSTDAVVFSVELGGCHRVLAADGVGWIAPQQAVDALKALATEPVLLK